MVNSKKKGNIWEHRLAKWLTSQGIRAWKDAGSGGGNIEKGDIGNDLDMTMECKASKNIKLMDWWGQTERSASLQRNQPVLFIHQDGMPEDEWLVVMNNHDWVEFVKGETQSEYMDPKLKWAIKTAVEALKKVLKYIEKYE